FCSRSSMGCHRPAALAWAQIGSPCCSPLLRPSATSSCFHCADQRNKLGLVFDRTLLAERWIGRSAGDANCKVAPRVIFGIEPRALDPSATPTYRSISKVTLALTR